MKEEKSNIEVEREFSLNNTNNTVITKKYFHIFRINILLLIIIAILSFSLINEMKFRENDYLNLDNTNCNSRIQFIGKMIKSYEESTALNMTETQKDECLMVAMNAYIDSVEDKYGNIKLNKDPVAISINNSIEGKNYIIGIMKDDINEDGYFKITNIAKDSPAEKANLKIGDKVVEVNGIKVIPANVEIIEKVFYDVKLGKLSEVKFILDDERKVSLEITQTPVVHLDWNKDTAIITIDGFNANAAVEFRKILKLVKGNASSIIFDLRQNSGGLIQQCKEMLDCLVSPGLMFINISSYGEEQCKTKTKGVDIPITLLVSENTASAAELFTLVLKERNNAIIVGTESYNGKYTYGKSTTLQTYHYLDKMTLICSIGNVLPPSKINIEDIGITPDFICNSGEEPLEWTLTNIGKYH